MEYEVSYGRTTAHRTASGSVAEGRPAEEVYHTLDLEHQCTEIAEDGTVQELEEKGRLTVCLPPKPLLDTGSSFD